MAENKEKNTFDSQLFGMTTIIECTCGAIKSQGSGFFFNDLAPCDPNNQGPQWRQINGTWLITNRHVAFPKINDKEIVPDSFSFNLRQAQNDQIEWLPITLTKDDLLKRTKIHQNPIVDVVAIKIDDLLINVVQATQGKGIISPGTITSDNLPSISPLVVDVTSDIVIASYPKGFYDKVNKFPIVKSGIVASSWGSYFNGQPVFLVDAPLFPGSSGGVVISKPVNIAVINGKIAHNPTKQFVLLGVYSGEPVYINRVEVDDMVIIQNKSFGLGNVWYAHLIPEIIGNGILHP